MLLSIQVVTVSGDPPSLERAIWRETIGRGLFANAFFALGYLWVAFGREKRGWHDYVSGTYVIRKAG